ncbi:alpha/beta hydrolase [Candidatus Viadribacter manganicus]|uniref:alpha/beta hydrolase n=1 Tax=Candidatus Viadribacter manganicus TaxID=1759059 RepID=UPI0012EA5211|nr:alpha/beta hydrolase [Candidatus Viadribacter manganicus]
MNIDPELCEFVGRFKNFHLSAETLNDFRKMTMGVVAQPDDLRVISESVTLPSSPGVLLLMHRPLSDHTAMPCALHMHGGGFVGGSAQSDAPSMRALAAETQCIIASVDYRLAPEAQYPAPLDDCAAAFALLLTDAARWRINTSRIGVIGESAGGGLAAGLALKLRDAGKNRPAFLHLIYPMLDDRTAASGGADNVPVWSGRSNQFGWRCYLGDALAASSVPIYAAPGRAPDLSGMPPTYLAVGDSDLFFSENARFARALELAGVEVEFDVYAGGVHGFMHAPSATMATKARANSAYALKRALAGSKRS